VMELRGCAPEGASLPGVPFVKQPYQRPRTDYITGMVSGA
jgi:hypothetical protein